MNGRMKESYQDLLVALFVVFVVITQMARSWRDIP
jgi:hypothetical protein